MVARQSAEAFSSSAVNKVENFANARKSLRVSLTLASLVCSPSLTL